MQEEFEKKIQERVHTFGIQPSHQVWDDIDAVLSKRKHRRVFVGWWILLGLVMIGGGILLYEKDNILHNDLNQHPVITNNDSINNNLANTKPATPTPEKENTVTDKEKLNQGQEIVKQDEEQIKQDKREIAQNSRITTARPNKKDGVEAMQSILPAIVSSGKAPAQENEITPTTGLTAEKKQPADNPTAYTPPAKEPPTLLPGDSKQINEKPQEDITGKPKEATATAATPSEKEAGKKDILKTTTRKTGHQWFFTVSGGTTQTISFGAFNQSENKSFADASQSVQGLTSPAVFKYDIARPGTGFHVTAGAEYQYNFSSRWSLSAGLRVAYLSNTQKTGALYENPLDITNGMYGYNNYASSGRIQSSYYQSGPSSVNSIVNRAWRVQLPVGVSYVVNPRGKTKLLLNAGVSVAQMFSSKWLIPDTRYGKLYYDKSVLNNTILSWQAGPLVQLRNQLKLGLSYEQSFTTMTKKYVSPKLYWQNVSVNVAIPLKSKSKKEKK